MKKNFEKWLNTMIDTVATWDYYTDFDKVYLNVEKIKIELNLLNSLIGSKNMRTDFINLVKKYPEVLKAIPILIAKREKQIKVIAEDHYLFDFAEINYTVEQYADFMEKTGLFNLLENKIVNNLIDYVYGVEVGIDTNARKNRTGKSMEKIVESYLKKAGLKLGETYFKEMNKTDIEKKFGLDLSKLDGLAKTQKRFDFVINYNSQIFAIECNFYSSGGSKLNETARSYKNLATSAKEIQGFNFVWFTDGAGWKSAKNNLEDTAEVLNELFNLNDLKNNIIIDLLKNRF